VKAAFGLEGSHLCALSRPLKGASRFDSLLAIVLWHGLFNALVASEAAAGLIAAIMTTGIMVLAVVALTRSGARDLTGLSRGTGQRRVSRAAARAAMVGGSKPSYVIHSNE
jgi:hypothetical protein